MSRICLFPGTFDPITMGHVDIIKRSIPLFDKMIIAIGVNSNKTPMFSLEQRTEWIKEIFKGHHTVEVADYTGLTIDFCKKVGANYIARGVRTIADFEYERAIADMNGALTPDIETIFLACAPAYSSISSTIVRDIIRNGGDVSQFVPSEIKV